jgi:hypothetical protein
MEFIQLLGGYKAVRKHSRFGTAGDPIRVAIYPGPVCSYGVISEFFGQSFGSSFVPAHISMATESGAINKDRLCRCLDWVDRDSRLSLW